MYTRIDFDIVWLDKFCGFDKASMPDNAVMLTVGGYTPERARMWLNHVPHGRIVSYEACRATYRRELLQPKSHRVQMIHGALAGRTGKTRLYHAESDTAHSTLWHSGNGEDVPAFTITDMVKECGGKIGLLYMNCEGAELYAFQDIARLPALQAAIPQICASFHCEHARHYPPATRDSIIADMVREYAVIPGRRAQDYFLFVKQPRM